MDLDKAAAKKFLEESVDPDIPEHIRAIRLSQLFCTHKWVVNVSGVSPLSWRVPSGEALMDTNWNILAQKMCLEESVDPKLSEKLRILRLNQLFCHHVWDTTCVGANRKGKANYYPATCCNLCGLFVIDRESRYDD